MLPGDKWDSGHTPLEKEVHLSDFADRLMGLAERAVAVRVYFFLRYSTGTEDISGIATRPEKNASMADSLWRSSIGTRTPFSFFHERTMPIGINLDNAQS